MKKKLYVIGLFITMFLLISQLWARKYPPPPIDPHRPRPIPGSTLYKTKADLKVEAVYLSSCDCRDLLNRTDAMYVKYLVGKVANRPPQIHIDDPRARLGTVRTRVTATFYDLTAGRIITISKNVVLPFNNSKEVIFFSNSPHLIKKSFGVTVRIEVPADVVYDTPNNNSKTINECVGPPIY